jgi:methyl-accepting chemotaxis protein
MALKLTIRQKITIFIVGTSIILFAFTIGYVSLTSRRMAYTDAVKLTDSYAKRYANNIESWLNSDFAIARTLSSAFQEYRYLPQAQWQELFQRMYRRVITVNPHIDAFWDSWELSNLDPAWDKPYGRYFYIVYRENGILKTKFETRSLTGDPPTYGAMKKAGKESVAEPYISQLQKGQMMTSLAAPLFEKGNFIGLVGIDLVLTRFEELVNEIKPFPSSHAFLLSNKGVFAAHPDTSAFRKNIADRFPRLVEGNKILERVQNGETFNFTYRDEQGRDFYYSFAPIEIGRTGTPWSLGVVVPVDVIMANANRNYNISILVGLIGLAFLIFVVFFMTNTVIGPINRITELLQKIAKGRIDKSMIVSLNTGDEISVMADALAASIEGLNEKAEFAKRIGHGNLDAEMKLLSEDDVLGISLLEMRDSLRKAKQEEELRKIEDEKRKWVNEGVAKFSDLLRQNNNNLQKLSDEIIRNLVWYLNAIQGGIFVSNDNVQNPSFELISAFAYDRKRVIKKTIGQREGLVGTCAAEKDIILLTEIPQEYIEITSGLGGANPNCLLLVPLTVEEEVLGVIEMASFNKFQPHEVDFVKKIAESIASTLHSVRMNAKTAELLQKSQEQAEMMSAQEEEMRQNMEELQATQEEAHRKSMELEGLVNALNSSVFVMEYDLKGIITNVNDTYQHFLGTSREDLIGTHHSDNLVLTDAQRQNYEQFWADLRKGNVRKQTTKLNIRGTEYLLLETYTPIKNQNGEVVKILKIGVDVTNIR